MARNCILHLADLHLGAPVSRELQRAFPHVAQGLQSARDNLLNRIADWIADRDCPVGLVLIAGDLFDHHAPKPDLEELAIQALSRIIAAGIPLVTVPGNHDELGYPNAVYRRRSWPGLLVDRREPTTLLELEDPTLPGRKLCIASASFERGKSKPGELFVPPDLPDGAVGIVLLHGVVADDGFLPSFLTEEPGVFRTILRTNAEKGYAYTALGHIHQRSTWRVNNMLACYPGPPIGTSPSDPGSGSLVVVRGAAAPGGISGETMMHVDYVDPPGLLPYRWILLEEKVTPGARPEDVLERLRARFPEDDRKVGALTLSGEVKSQAFAEDCQALFIRAGLPVIVAETKTRQLPPVDLELLRQETSLLGEWVRVWQKWQETEKPDPAFAEQVMWEALIAFGRTVKSGESS